MPGVAPFMSLLTKSGFFNPWVDLTDQQRFDLLGGAFWSEVAALGYDVVALKSYCWKMTGRSESDFIQNLR